MAPISEAICSILTFTESHVAYCSTNKPTTLLLDFIKTHYLEDGCKNLFQLMFVCNDMSTRMYIAKITAKVINKCFIIYGVCSEGKDKDHPRIQELYAALDEVMGFIFHKLMDPECQKNWSRLANYFNMLNDIAQGGKYQTQYILEKFDFVVDICDLMLGQKSPKVAKETEKRVSMGGQIATPFGPLVQLLSHLVRSMHTE